MKTLVFKLTKVYICLMIMANPFCNLLAQYVKPGFDIQFYELENLSCDMAMVKLRIRFTGDIQGQSGENVYDSGMNIHIHCYPEPNTNFIVRIDPATTDATLNSLLTSQTWFGTSYSGMDEEELLLSGTNPSGPCCTGNMEFVEGVVYDLCTIYMYVEGEALLQFEDMVTPPVTFDYHETSTSWIREEIEIHDTWGEYPLYVDPISGNYNISGTVLRQPNDPNTYFPDGMPLVGVSILITNPDPDVDVKSVANFDGDWCFPAAYNDTHTIELYGMGIGEKLCGVSTADIIKIQRHILNIESFNARWKKLAADVNDNLYITAADIACIRLAILGLESGYCSGLKLPWRFETTVSYGQNHNPELVREKVYADLVSNTTLTGKDFYGYKVADVDGSCDDCQTLQNEEFEIRSNSDTLTLALGNPQPTGVSGNYKIPVYCKLETHLTLLSISIHDPSSSLLSLSSWYLDFDGTRGDYIINGNGSDVDLMWMVDTVESVEVSEDTLLFYIIASDSTNNFSLNATPVSQIRNSWYPSTSDSGPVKLIKEAGSFGIMRKNLFAYPNPAKHELIVSLKDAGFRQANLSIMSLEGQNMILIEDVSSDNVVVPVHQLNPGMYMIMLENQHKHVVQKWIKW